MVKELCLLLRKTKQGNFYRVLHLYLNITVDLIYSKTFVFSVMANISGLLKTINRKNKLNCEINAMQSSPDTCSF